MGISRTAAPAVPATATLWSTAFAFGTQYGFRRLTSAIPPNALGIRFSRALIAGIMAGLGTTPPGTRTVPVRANGVIGEWVLGPDVYFGSRAIYYVHGSAYVICSARTHRGLAARLSAVTGQPVFVVDYRLAPEHPFPAAADDVAAGYQWLRGQGYDGSELSLAGDSAGGHLAFDLLLNDTETHADPPSAVVLFSPLIDLSFALAAQQERLRPDPAITAAAARKLVALYTAGQDPAHRRLRLDFTRADRLPPVLIQVGSTEMLSADARYAAAEINRHGGSCELEVWPGLMHVFQALPRAAPQAAVALARVAAFLAATETRTAVTEMSN